MKKFVSRQNWYSLEYPEDWIWEEEKQEGTYLFYNPDKLYLGALRTTAILVEQKEKSNFEEWFSDYLLDELNEIEEARMLKFGKYAFLNYIEFANENGIDLIMEYWQCGHHNIILTISYTIEEEQKDDLEILEERNLVGNIIESIEI